MDHAFDVSFGHQLVGKFAGECRFDFAFILAQLRRNVSHTQTRVDLFLSSRQTRKTDLLFLGELLNLLDMSLRTGLDEQRYGKILRRYCSERDHSTISQLRKALGSISQLTRYNQRKLLKLLDERGGIVSARDEIDRAHSFFPATQRTGYANLDYSITRL